PCRGLLAEQRREQALRFGQPLSAPAGDLEAAGHLEPAHDAEGEAALGALARDRGAREERDAEAARDGALDRLAAAEDDARLHREPGGLERAPHHLVRRRAGLAADERRVAELLGLDLAPVPAVTRRER